MTENRPDPRQIGLGNPTDAGGAKAEGVYAAWHKRFGQKLKRKYRDVGTAKRNRGRKT